MKQKRYAEELIAFALWQNEAETQFPNLSVAPYGKRPNMSRLARVAFFFNAIDRSQTATANRLFFASHQIEDFPNEVRYGLWLDVDRKISAPGAARISTRMRGIRSRI